MQFLTALDMVGVPSASVDEWSSQLSCPWCGEDAWAVSNYFQCCSPACQTQVASAEDLLAKYLGGYLQAEHFAATELRTEPNEAAAARRQQERAVLDMWFDFCLTPPTSDALQAINRFQSHGFGIRQSRFNAVVLNAAQMSALIDLAERTGASYPDSWRTQRPGGSRAFCVQTRPHVIDRIVILTGGRSKEEEIVWYRHAAGFCSLVGLTPKKPRLVAADLEVMLRMQHDLAALGCVEEVASVHLDLFDGEACPRWEMQGHLLTAVPRHCKNHEKEEYFGPGDIIRLQRTIDQFPGIERSVRGMMIDTVMELQPRDRAISWAGLRRSVIAEMLPPHVTQVTPACASIFEQTGTKPEDAVALIDYFKRKDRHQLAKDFELLSLTRVISHEARLTVKETANDYRILRGADTALLSNFSLRIYSVVTFKNHNADRYCRATLRCGSAVMDVLFPQNLLHDRVQGLEDELQRQLTVSDKATEARLMPTVIDVSKFRSYVVPHLRNQAAKAAPVRGVDLLGWSEDRKTFTFPGFMVTMDGVERTSNILCPSIQVLRRFKPVKLKSWAASCPDGLDQSCQDMVAILLASCVRYFRRCITKPIQIAQSSDAITVLDRLTAAFGQHEIHPLNQNVREGNRIEGIHGYPMLAAGPRAAAPVGSQTPFLHLTDQGYVLPTSPDPNQADAGARAAQYCLKTVVEWCLGTGGDAFKEIPSLSHHRSLLREGRWLVENVCRLEEWDVSQSAPTSIERLLEQIPYEAAGQRITLVDGQNLVIDIRGLSRDHDGILREARDMGTLVAIEGDKIMSPAVKLLPAISTYYGQDPDVTVVTT
jgi:hypothetical protein